MANFRPLKQHMFLCLDRFIAQYGLHGPFLEVGCGKGDVSAHLARRHGWSGLAIDFSDAAIVEASQTLARHADVVVRRQALAEVRGSFACILAWDVLEHIEDDRGALRTLEALLAPGGQLLLAVPSNPREWRWDDDFYGHFRRYTVAELRAKLAEAGLQPQAFWDFTFPSVLVDAACIHPDQGAGGDAQRQDGRDDGERHRQCVEPAAALGCARPHRPAVAAAQPVAVPILPPRDRSRPRILRARAQAGAVAATA